MNKKFFLIAASITIFILVLVLIFSPKKSSNLPQSLPTSTPVTRPELIDLTQEKRRATMVYVSSIESKLPIYLESFNTSVGITTTINLYRLKDDEAEVVRLEIYGLSYMNIESDPLKNPNVVAYKESYLKAIELLESKNIDPKKLIFIYSDKEYIRKTSSTWIDALKLQP